MNNIKTEAVVLRKRSLPNEDFILSFFTMELGKVTIFAKGIKKITSRRLPHLQTGNLVNTVLHQSKDHWYLQETTLISAFSKIKESSEKLNWNYALLFLVDRLLPEQQKEEVLYATLKKFLVTLSSTTDSASTFGLFANKMLRELGYTKEEKTLSEIKELVGELTGEKIPYNTI